MASQFNIPELSTEYSKSPASMYGAGLDSASQPVALAATESPTHAAAQGAQQAMNSGSTSGGMLTSAGLSLGIGSLGATSGTALAAAGPAGLGIMAGGLALSAYENSQKADAMNEQARIKEAADRKAAVQGALTNALSATRQLGV
jgi:hypothetical protein